MLFRSASFRAFNDHDAACLRTHDEDMAPLTDAINAEFAHRESGKGGKAVYRGEVDGEWTVLA